ncbi:hypothetical protein PIB30_001363 [Stylosanthes scabra]|uniref:Pentatricopeptide repeat-containing protein n=1 Tax=Stylosanthes scabra TaxID=79078 RepID=A0ABU6Y396_9FABA|nr:hypothetical protein [Stylosanthes scabra]
MYSKRGSLSAARQLFDVVPHRGLITWNAILSAYARATDADTDNAREGFQLFRLLRESFTLHGYAVKIGLEWDVFVAGALVNIYAKFGRIREARVLFDGIPVKDAILWNVMIRAYVKMGLQDEALLLFAAFHRSGLRPDDTSVRSVLLGAPRIDLEWQLMQVRAYATKLLQFDVDPEVVMWNKTLWGVSQSWTDLESD